MKKKAQKVLRCSEGWASGGSIALSQCSREPVDNSKIMIRNGSESRIPNIVVSVSKNTNSESEVLRCSEGWASKGIIVEMQFIRRSLL